MNTSNYSQRRWEEEQEQKKQDRIAKNILEATVSDKLKNLLPEIKELNQQISEDEQLKPGNPGWKYNRKADKLDEKIEAYELTLKSELKTINEKYDLKEKKLKMDIEAKIKKLRELEETELEKIALERERGIEGKTREYDTYISKREKEKCSILQDKDEYLENMPVKVSNIRKKRFLRQKIEEYKKIIKEFNSNVKDKNLHYPENYGLDFLNSTSQKSQNEISKPNPEVSNEKQKNNTPLAKKEDGVENFIFYPEISKEVPEIQNQNVQKKKPRVVPPTIIKEVTKPIPEEVTPSLVKVNQTDSLIEYQKFREKYKLLYGEELPDTPEEYGF